MDRVQKFLSNWGYCSRRQAEELIDQGRVAVNGEFITLGDKAKESDTITVDGERVRKPNQVYIMFHKPPGCVTALKDEHKKTIMEFIDIKERVFPIGRLDYNTSGLLLLTNDGDFANRVMHPRYETKKTYVVKVNAALNKNTIKALENGIELKDGKTRPARIKRLSSNKLSIQIHEGKHKIVKRMMKELGYRVVQLQRQKIGKLALGKLPLGRWRYLTEKERDIVLEKQAAKKLKQKKKIKKKKV